MGRRGHARLVPPAREVRIDASNIAASARPREHVEATDLCQEARDVEVDALVRDAITFEEEHRNRRYPERLAGWLRPEELTRVRTEQVELGDHRVVVGHMDPYVLVTLVGE